MATRNEWLLLAIVFGFFSNGVTAQDQQPQTAAGIVGVNDLVGKPADHLGQVQLIGVVAAVSQGKGFVLVDKREYADCGLSYVAEPGAKKLPVRWSGDAPKLEQTVQVEGTIRQTDKGLSFVAQEVRLQGLRGSYFLCLPSWLSLLLMLFTPGFGQRQHPQAGLTPILAPVQLDRWVFWLIGMGKITSLDFPMRWERHLPLGR